MGTNHYDVVVIGAGLSGLIAATTAANQDMTVALVATGPGSFALAPGWLKTEDSTRTDAVHELEEAITFFRTMTQLAGCSFDGGISNARFLPTVLGDFQSVALAPLILWNGEPREGTSTAVVGIRGLSAFDEDFMAARLNEQAHAIASNCTYTARQISISRDLGTPVTPLRIATYFDRDPGFRAELIEALRAVMSGAARILVPGMLGLHSSDEEIARFEDKLGCEICEMPTLPPSVPSLRVFNRMQSYLRQIGVELYLGYPVQKMKFHGERCIELEIASPGHPMIVHGTSVVLAAGQRSVNLLGDTYAGPDIQMRPLTSTGSLISRNLFVAGSLLSNGTEYDGDAMEILMGYRAGNLAASTRGNHAA